VSIEHWSAALATIVLECGTEDTRQSVAWSTFFSAWVPFGIQRTAVDYEQSNLRSDRLWRSLLRIHAILPSHRLAPRCNGRLGAIVKMSSSDRCLADLAEGIDVLVKEDNAWARQWEMAQRSPIAGGTGPINERRPQIWSMVQGVVLDRLRRYVSCVMPDPSYKCIPENVPYLGASLLFLLFCL
jgi:hypothetical protein